MGRLSCGVQCTRVLLFLLNILFIICGFIILGFGIYVKVSKRFDIAFPDDINEKIKGGEAIEWVGVAMIVIAVFTILLAAFGCLGATFKNRCFLYLYAIILSLLIVAEIAAFSITLSARVKIRDSYTTGFHEFFIEAYSNNHTDLEAIIEDMQREFKCCGAHNVTDYYNRNFTVPASCHRDKNLNEPIFDKGCANAIIDWISDQFPIIGAVLGTILLIEIFGVISAIALGIGIAHSPDDQIYYSNY